MKWYVICSHGKIKLTQIIFPSPLLGCRRRRSSVLPHITNTCFHINVSLKAENKSNLSFINTLVTQVVYSCSWQKIIDGLYVSAAKRIGMTHFFVIIGVYVSPGESALGRLESKNSFTRCMWEISFWSAYCLESSTPNNLSSSSAVKCSHFTAA